MIALFRYRMLLAGLLLLPVGGYAQGSIARLLQAEYEAGHFSGTVLVAHEGRPTTYLSHGLANRQFAVPIGPDTRFPIASLSKTFTAILVLQLVEQNQLRLSDKVAAYLPELPASCQDITLLGLLTHHSGLLNEPAEAYAAPYSPAQYVSRFVRRADTLPPGTFHYNNVDYVVLTRVLEVVTQQPFARLLQTRILTPLQMYDSGVVREERVIPRLAYGYHNYTFGASTARDTLRNDAPRYLSNYAGAGALYSTAADLLRLTEALRHHTLLSAATTAALVRQPQQAAFIDYARGYPTIGFYYNDKTLPQPVLERRGSIEGFNSVLLTDPEFRHVVIMLTNTDAADLEVLADRIYKMAR
ncbi:serine hydrolase domain-containing protein [Hymenobacter rigui]|uniref:Class A beta-lactamase-related serine hydrolase n=1 Tax=Hymenobacter rigui TaxID=334424 RepID=A0A3R9MMN9_9BACT|nr:serine hydrolase domain-containing protein [Hymenobacter rigui]RSK44024.1 class A beta-lactamase-related serine hydrolase [Hymenobacter rigui]